MSGLELFGCAGLSGAFFGSGVTAVVIKQRRARFGGGDTP